VRTGTDEQPRTDLRVRVPPRDESGDRSWQGREEDARQRIEASMSDGGALQRQLAQRRILIGRSGREDQCDRLREQTASDECERVRRSLVEPLPPLGRPPV